MIKLSHTHTYTYVLIICVILCTVRIENENFLCYCLLTRFGILPNYRCITIHFVVLYGVFDASPINISSFSFDLFLIHSISLSLSVSIFLLKARFTLFIFLLFGSKTVRNGRINEEKKRDIFRQRTFEICATGNRTENWYRIKQPMSANYGALQQLIEVIRLKWMFFLCDFVMCVCMHTLEWETACVRVLYVYLSVCMFI